MFDTTVVRPGKADRHVKDDLGWLLHHASEVEAFTLAKMPRGHAWDGYMVAHLSDGGEFRTRWASAELMLRWLRRPTFRGSPGTSPEELIQLALTAEDEDILVRGNASATGWNWRGNGRKGNGYRTRQSAIRAAIEANSPCTCSFGTYCPHGRKE